jgi:hypothetical protein
MAEMFKDGFIDRAQNSIHASECCTRAVYLHQIVCLQTPHLYSCVMHTTEDVDS